MPIQSYVRTLTAAAGCAALIGIGLIGAPAGQAANDNNGSQDEKLMSQTGLSVAAAIGVQLNLVKKDSDMVGLGSYLVNVTGDCNGCHSRPQEAWAPGGNPYLLAPAFNGRKQVNALKYLGGNQSFGSFGIGPKAEIISRNITPDKNGLPAGQTLARFMQILRTGVDLDGAHPSCGGAITTDCLSFPFNGNLLQVMPWPAFQSLTDRQITAIYTYLTAIPCLEGGPGEAPGRCQ